MKCNVFNRDDYGGYWTRHFSHGLDAFLLGVIFVVVEFAVVKPILEPLAGKPITEDEAWIWMLPIFLAYMIGFKSYRGTTPGYRILGIKIVAINGADVTVAQIVIRLIASVFSALALGLGFIWIAFDQNKQAWHDKVAGTYVVRTKATPVQEVEIPQTRLIRTGLFAAIVLIGSGVFAGVLGGIFISLKSSDAYHLSEQYIQDNPWVKDETGIPVEFGPLPSMNISITGASGEAYFEIYVTGDKGEITVTTELEKSNASWRILEAGYIDKEGIYVDITRPYDVPKIVE